MRKILQYEMIAMLLISGLVAVLAYGFPAQITAVFNSEKNQPLQRMAEIGLQLYFSGAVFAGCNIVLGAFFAAAARERPAQLISVLRGFALMIPAAFCMASLFGVTGVWLSFPFTEGCVALLGGLLYLKYRDVL